MRHVLAAALTIAALAIAPVTQAAGGQVIVNKQPITSDDVAALEWYYGVTIASGAYWYDPVSGLWGSEGGPSTGQIAPGLDLGGPLRSDASNGHTGVFFNGRQLHQSEVDYLRRLFGSAPPGRYWLAPNGVGGLEGGPAAFSLAAGNSGGTNYGGYTDRGAFGTYGSDGNCFYIAVDGADVSNC